jgi:hypothetical protein
MGSQPTERHGQRVCKLRHTHLTFNRLHSRGFISFPFRTGPYGVAIDQSGNVWPPRTGNPSTVYEIVGAAAPVVVPIVQAVKSNSLGTRH